MQDMQPQTLQKHVARPMWENTFNPHLMLGEGQTVRLPQQLWICFKYLNDSMQSLTYASPPYPTETEDGVYLRFMV